jgi:Flp pilus assembly protein TadD
MEYERAEEHLAINLTEVMALQGKSQDDINAAAKEVLTRHPRMHQMAIGLAVQLLQTEATQGEALRLIRGVATAEPVAPVQQLLTSAEILGAFVKWDEALASLNRGEVAYPNDPRLPVAEAQIHFRLGNQALAIDAMRKASEIKPPNPEVMLSYAALLRQYGKQAEAVEVERQAQSLLDASTAASPTPPPK